MKTIVVTQEEIIKTTRPNIYRNRKKYTRKINIGIAVTKINSYISV